MFACLFAVAAMNTSSTLDLAGTWRCALDREDRGVTERWFTRDLTTPIHLPGSLQTAGIGDPVTAETNTWIGNIIDKSYYTSPEYAKYRAPGNVKIPFWLQPNKVYVGAAWYQREIEVPAGWQGKRVLLSLERTHWETQLWVDDHFQGRQNSLGTPHQYDLGPLAPGRHRVSIRVDNRMLIPLGIDSHSISDHTQGNWNGLVGRLQLKAEPTTWVDDLQVYPHVATKTIQVHGKLAGATPGQDVQLEVADSRGTIVAEATLRAAGDGTFATQLPLGSRAKTWDEFRPNLYHLTATAQGNPKKVAFGLREISTKGTEFVLNGTPIFIRGTLECAIFPKTGHPPTDIDAWRRVIRVAKSCGLNLLRFHSWCPPDAAFEAADELGFYFQIEICSWGEVGDHDDLNQWLYAEADRILKRYGNHPSFLLMPYGNEPLGKNSNTFLAEWVKHFRAQDSRRLYTSGSGWPQLAENQFHVTPDPRIQAWGEGVNSRINAKVPETETDYRSYIQARTVPVISHEIGQWCVYPDFSEIPKYTGYLKPKNFEVFRDFLNEHHQGDLARKFLLASGKLQALCYKEDIESALRTPGMGGFQLLDLHDFPGQGTALVGVLSPFWETKGYITPREYARFCGPVVPLLRMPKRVYTGQESIRGTVEVAQYGPGDLKDTEVSWRLLATSGEAVKAGSFGALNLPVGGLRSVGALTIPLAGVPAPAQYKVEIRVGARIANDWDVWVYPSKPTEAKDVTVLRDPDAAYRAAERGERVLLVLPGDRVRNDNARPVKLGFSTIFWNTAWTSRQAPTTMGVFLDPKAPLFADFPTDDFSNWNWWYLVTRSQPLLMDGLPVKLRPGVGIVDDWTTARRLGLAFEAKVGKGLLMVTSINLTDNVNDPVTRQFRASVLNYMASDAFHPQVAVTESELRSILNP